MMKSLALALYFVFFLCISFSTSFLFERDGLLLVPSVAFRDPNTNDWSLHSQGWYYEENSAKALLIEKSMELVIQKDLDRERVKMFTAEGKENKNICINGLARSICTKTDDEGRIKTTFSITNGEMLSLRKVDNHLSYQVSVVNKNLNAPGEIYLCDNNGVTFISDIDDTIKITEVSSATQTLINTFSGQFKPVPGMAEIYRHWQAKYNATFAYLTASPDQLYPFLRSFFDREQFPAGSAHMRHFTWLDANFISFFMSSNYMKKKSETLEMFLKNTKNRKFVLLGDIFQKDPDIYAEIYAQYPDRISKIFIRKYANDVDGQNRLENVFANVPSNKWQTFESGSDLPRDISFL